MFTGLIETTARVVLKKHDSVSLAFNVPFFCAQGDSVAVNGVCLTVTGVRGSNGSDGVSSADFDISHESSMITNLSNLNAGSVVNIERAMPADGRFHGHFVSGHVDTTGKIANIIKQGKYVDLKIYFDDDHFSAYVHDKGSIAVNGVSLTINKVTDKKTFLLTLIPHTTGKTNLSDLKTGDTVNIEFDLLAKYVFNSLKNINSGIKSDLDESKLRSLGYV